MTFAYAPLLPGTALAAAALAQLPGAYSRRCRPVLSVGAAAAPDLPDALAGLARLEILLDVGPEPDAHDVLLNLVQRARARGADHVVPLVRVPGADAREAARALRPFARTSAVAVGVTARPGQDVGAAYELAVAALAHRGHPPERAHVVLLCPPTITATEIEGTPSLAGADQLASLALIADAGPPPAGRVERPEAALWRAARETLGAHVSLGDTWHGPPEGPPLYASGRYIYRIDDAPTAWAVARAVVEAPYFLGPEFSRGDTILQMMSEGDGDAASYLPLQAWVALLNHHLVATLHGLLHPDAPAPRTHDPSPKTTLATYWAARIRHVKIVARADACGPCKARQGAVLSVREAQRTAPLPCSACENARCRCVYVPVVPE